MRRDERYNASYMGAMRVESAMGGGYGIGFRVVIDGIFRHYIVNHGHYEDIAEELNTVIAQQFPSAKTIEIVASGDVSINGAMGESKIHHQQPEILAINKLPVPDYTGKVHEIDGRKYRLEAVD